MKPPPWLNDPCALILVDWSWWLNRAMHGREGIDGMLSLVIGWLCHTLAYEPAHLAICLDSPGETWRHRLRHPTDPEWRYKSGRPPKPEAFSFESARATRIAELHGIPILWADGYEADDVIATAVAQARAAGYRVWICSGDKDLHHLVEDDSKSGLIVGTWNPFERDAWVWRGPKAVREEYGVEPAQIPDWLAIGGDDSDGIPGIENKVGAKSAAAILAEYGTLAAALDAPVWSTMKGEEIEAEIKALEKPAKTDAGAKDRRDALMRSRRIAGFHLTLQAHAAVARFCRELTVLDCDAPIDLPWEDLPLGGYDVAELRATYVKLGWTLKAAQVPHREKRQPWRIPWQAEDGAPAPRRIDGEGDRRAHEEDGERPGESRAALEGPRGEAGDVSGWTGGRHPVGAGTDQGGAQPPGAPVTPSPWCCSYSGCLADPVHRRIVDATAAIRDLADAVGVCGLVQKSGMLELPRVEHARIAMDRGRAAAEGRAA